MMTTRKKMTKVYVFGGTVAQSRQWGARNNYHPNEVIHVFGPDQLRGVPRGTKVFLVGTYQARHDYRRLNLEATLRSLHLVQED